MAKQSHEDGDLDRAEAEYLETLEGHRHLLSPTHEETLKIAFQLANFYAQQNEPRKADQTLEKVTEAVIERYGVDHQKTFQHTLDMVDHLKSWNRESDALALIAHFRDVYEKGREEPQRKGRNRGARGKGGMRREESPSTRIRNLRQNLGEVPNTARLDHGLGAARLYVATGEPSAENLLARIETICMPNYAVFGKQAVLARAETLRLYNKLNVWRHHPDALSSTNRLVNDCWNAFVWDSTRLSSLDFLEACMAVAAELLRAGLQDAGIRLFRRTIDKAEEVFGDNDERTIWVAITIGLVYQRFRGWDVARLWFERGLAAALMAYKGNDGIVRSLEMALENKHFSYITDEGRPYTTIFGVNGLTIRPRRLHLE
jgi:hypothetical protein